LGGAAQLLSLGSIMRVCFIIVGVLGIFLICLPLFEVRAVRTYISKVNEVQAGIVEWDKAVRAEDAERFKPQHVVFNGPTLDQEFGSRLEGADAFERGWFIVAFAGAVLLFVGVCGIIFCRKCTYDDGIAAS
jgi:hypothetical protein